MSLFKNLFFFIFFIVFHGIEAHCNEHQWMDDQIRRDLAPFNGIKITQKMIKYTLNNSPSYLRLAHYVIINGELNVISLPKGENANLSDILGLKAFIKYVHEKLYPLPNVEFLCSWVDGIDSGSASPLEGDDKVAPIFCAAKDESVKKAVLFLDGSMSFFPNISYDARNWPSLMQVIPICSKEIPWEQKKEIMIWRGVASDGYKPNHGDIYDRDNWNKIPRGKLVYLSQLRPDLLDAKFNGDGFNINNSGWKELVKICPPVAPINVQEHIKYKYQIAMDGVMCTYPGFLWRLYSNCVVFKQTSPQIQWFYGALKPYIHYIPVANDLSDLFEKIEWAKQNDFLARKISENAYEFVCNNLLIEHIGLYVYKLLTAYAKLQAFEVTDSIIKNR